MEESLSSYPDRKFAGYVCDGIRDGFRVGFSYGTSVCKRAVGNMKSVKEHKEVVEAYIGGERQAGRVLGPFSKESLPHVQVSPFGVIPNLPRKDVVSTTGLVRRFVLCHTCQLMM